MFDRIKADQEGYAGQNPGISEKQAYDMAKLNEVNRVRVQTLTTGASDATVERVIEIAKGITNRIGGEK